MNNFFIPAWLALAVLVSNCGHKENDSHKAATFVVSSPVKKDTILYNSYVCQMHSIQHIELRALERGYLQNIYVDEGQVVKKGQRMFQVMPLIYQAETQRAEAEVNIAEIEFLNTKNLADKYIVSSTELALGKARLGKAQAELALAKAHLSFTQISAPYGGIMDRFHVRLGSLIDEGDLLTTLSDNSKMWVYFNVPEAEYLDYITRKRSDTLLRVKLEMANHQLFEQVGVVETIEADFNNETGNIAFRATFPNPKRILRHGETGNVLMPTVLKGALLIPQMATFEILDKKYVFVVDEQGMVKSRQITVNAELPHLYAVTEGITDKDKILIEGLRKVKNNQKIYTEFKPLRTILAELSHLHAE